MKIIFDMPENWSQEKKDTFEKGVFEKIADNLEPLLTKEKQQEQNGIKR